MPVDLSAMKMGSRVLYTIPERGGFRYGFGDVVKVNRITVDVIDMKFGKDVHRVDKALIYEVINFEDMPEPKPPSLSLATVERVL